MALIEAEKFKSRYGNYIQYIRIDIHILDRLKAKNQSPHSWKE